MKEINKTTVIIALTTLVIGLGLGWFLFSNNESPTTEHVHDTKQSSEEWTCSMHPQIRQAEAGDCPLCGMDLIPVNTGDEDLENPMEVKMSPTAMQLASVQTAIVSKKKPIKELRLTGKVQADESSINTQTTHISGRIEKLLVNTTGEYIRKGQTIAYIYSPELVTAQKELFEAKKMEATNPQLFQAAKDKLKNWKLTNKQISKILESGKPSENFPILSDRNGIVLNKRINLGDHVMQGASLFEVADLSKVWVLFDVYESDMSWVKKGNEITYQIQSLPGKSFSGTISFIDPVINPKTRVAKARVVTTNKGLELKPEMFVSGIVNSSIQNQKEAIIIPKSAVMWTGKKSVVYVKTSDHKGIGFVMRKITIGASLGKSVLVNEGLEEGEEIAVHGTFSIDAAAQLAGKPSMMNPEGGMVMTGHNHGGGSMKTSKSHIEHTSTIGVSTEAKSALKPLYSSYLSIKNALVRDDYEQAIKSSDVFKSELSKINMSVFKGLSHDYWMNYQKDLKKSIENSSKSTTIEEVRKQFLLLSKYMIGMGKTFELYNNTLFIQHCPMANDNKGADWLSIDKEIKNPYYGASMLTCGEVTEELK